MEAAKPYDWQGLVSAHESFLCYNGTTDAPQVSAAAQQFPTLTPYRAAFCMCYTLCGELFISSRERSIIMSFQPPPNSNDPTYQTPHTQFAPPPPKRKRRIWPWIVLVAILIIFYQIGRAAISPQSTSPIATQAPATEIPTTPPLPTLIPTEAPPSVAKVGDTITVNDVDTTLVSVKKIAGDEFTQPKPGNTFIVVHVRMKNNSAGEVDYNEFDFHVRSGSGNITDADVSPSTYTANNELNYGKLSPGGTVEGDIIFQVKKGDHKAELTWQPSILGNAGDNVWNLGV